MLVLGTTVLRGAPVEADPHDLYTSALNDLTKGDLQAADAALARLRAIIKASPQWDPEGVFARELLPPLSARLKRLQGAARKLDAFNARARQELRPPDPVKDTSTVRNYTDWATSVIQRLRAERDAIISADLADPEDRAILMRTESYARTQRFLETDGLRRMADAAGDDILGLLAGDPNQESILLRFRQLKLELMQAVADRDRLSEELDRYRNDARTQTAGAIPPGDAAPAKPFLRRPARVTLVVALVVAFGLLVWAVNARRRRMAARKRSLDDTCPGLVAGAQPPNADRDAA
jgi:hypothetical protein